jgi:hypothetical protein
VVCDAGRHVLW